MNRVNQAAVLPICDHLPTYWGVVNGTSQTHIDRTVSHSGISQKNSSQQQCIVVQLLGVIPWQHSLDAFSLPMVGVHLSATAISTLTVTDACNRYTHIYGMCVIPLCYIQHLKSSYYIYTYCTDRFTSKISDWLHCCVIWSILIQPRTFCAFKVIICWIFVLLYVSAIVNSDWLFKCCYSQVLPPSRRKGLGIDKIYHLAMKPHRSWLYCFLLSDWVILTKSFNLLSIIFNLIAPSV